MKSPSLSFDPHTNAITEPALVKRLENLDDIIFPAIDGGPEALDGSGTHGKKESRTLVSKPTKKLAANICVMLKTCGSFS